MSWRTIVIASRFKPDYKMGFMVVRGEETKRIFLDEIAILLIENQKFFLEFTKSLSEQINGGEGKAILSIADKPVEMSKYAFIFFPIAIWSDFLKAFLFIISSSFWSKAALDRF